MDISIVPMNRSHIRAMASVEKQSFSEPWSENAIEQELDNRLARYLVAVRGDEVAGYIGFYEVAGECYITNLAVAPERRRAGIGQALLTAAIEDAQERQNTFITLEVRPSNLAAVRLYQKNGFQEAGRRKEYYRKPVEDALILTKYLNEVADG